MILYPPIPSPPSSPRAPPPFVPLVRFVQPPFIFYPYLPLVLACGTLFFLSFLFLHDRPPPSSLCANSSFSIPFYSTKHILEPLVFSPHSTICQILPVLYIQCFPLPAAQPPSRSLPPSDITIHILSGRICGSLSCLFSALTGALFVLFYLFTFFFPF